MKQNKIHIRMDLQPMQLKNCITLVRKDKKSPLSGKPKVGANPKRIPTGQGGVELA